MLTLLRVPLFLVHGERFALAFFGEERATTNI
jgi:hypothetical protein